MRFFMGIKYNKDGENRAVMEDLMARLNRAGHYVDSISTNSIEGPPLSEEATAKLMQSSFNKIDNSDALIIEFSRRGVGLGIEAGYAYAVGKPVYIIAESNSHIPKTMRSIASEILYYDNVEDLMEYPIFRESLAKIG